MSCHEYHGSNGLRAQSLTLRYIKWISSPTLRPLRLCLGILQLLLSMKHGSEVRPGLESCRGFPQDGLEDHIGHIVA